MAAGSTAAAYRRVWEAEVLPALRAFEPELLFVSAGFDAHARDPLAELCLLEEDYARMTRDLLELAQGQAARGLVSLLEGGYDLSALGASARAHVRALAALP
jgi:acetoin utilization deacetylase AcuC-like enzyme